jgi:hypothetical protein
MSALGSLYGMRVRQSIHAVAIDQWRKHEKKSWHSESYHKRIMKKWRKRFGVRHVPAMYQLGADTLVIHPDLMPQLLAVTSTPPANTSTKP